MHRFTLTVSVLSLLISFSCNHYSRQEKADHENLVICCYDTIDKHHPTVSIDDISYIPLETNDRSLIGSINKIIYRNQRFHIFDRMNMKIFIFDEKGKFLSVINKRGNAPGEYVEAIDMDVDNDDHVYVLDNAKTSIVQYTLPAMEYKIINIGLHCRSFCCLNKDLFALSDVFGQKHTQSKLLLFSTEEPALNVLLSPEYEEVNESRLFAVKPFYRSANKVYYYKRFAPIIYSIDNEGELRPEMKIMSDKYLSEEGVRQLEEADLAAYIQEQSHIKDIVDLYENDAYFLFRACMEPTMNYTVYSKSDKHFSSFLYDEQLNGCTQIKGVAENKFIVELSHPQYMKKIADEILNINIDEDSNPFLVLFNLKLHK